MEGLTTALWFDRGQSDETWLLAFEAYGHAMAAAASLEMQLSLFLVKKRSIDIQKGRYPRMSDSDASTFADRLRKAKFPKLITKLRREFSISEDLFQALQLARKARDFLAHDFWEMNIGFVHSDRGVELLVEQCSNDAWHFKNVSNLLEREIGFDVHDFADITANSAANNIADLDILLSKFR